jgi:osmotically-inducible protein OsmY
VKSDTDLAADVTGELLFDPRIENVDAVAVGAEDGTVTLRGTVGSFHEKRAAAKAAKRVLGVKAVENELQVRLMTDARRSDSDIRAAALQALMLDGLVPSDSIDVNVRDGVLALTGLVAWDFQRDAAEEDVLPLIGIVDIDDRIAVVNETTAEDVSDRINAAFIRNAQLDDGDIEVSSTDGAVTLNGVVGNWAEHDEAVHAAWSAPGVTTVRDQLAVIY